MTTVIEQIDEQAERPFQEIDEVPARIASSTGEILGSPDRARDPVGLGVTAARDSLRRLAEDPRSAFIAVFSAFAFIVVVALFWSLRLRPRPSTPEELLLERSRETFDRSRDALEAIVARLTSSIER